MAAKNRTYSRTAPPSPPPGRLRRAHPLRRSRGVLARHRRRPPAPGVPQRRTRLPARGRSPPAWQKGGQGKHASWERGEEGRRPPPLLRLFPPPLHGHGGSGPGPHVYLAKLSAQLSEGVIAREIKVEHGGEVVGSQRHQNVRALLKTSQLPATVCRSVGGRVRPGRASPLVGGREDGSWVSRSYQTLERLRLADPRPPGGGGEKCFRSLCFLRLNFEVMSIDVPKSGPGPEVIRLNKKFNAHCPTAPWAPSVRAGTVRLLALTPALLVGTRERELLTPRQHPPFFFEDDGLLAPQPASRAAFSVARAVRRGAGPGKGRAVCCDGGNWEKKRKKPGPHSVPIVAVVRGERCLIHVPFTAHRLY